MRNKFQCSEIMAPGVTCVLAQGHDGPHVMPKVRGKVCECPVCGKSFASIDELDAHAPCEGKEPLKR